MFVFYRYVQKACEINSSIKIDHHQLSKLSFIRRAEANIGIARTP